MHCVLEEKTASSEVANAARRWVLQEGIRVDILIRVIHATLEQYSQPAFPEFYSFSLSPVSWLPFSYVEYLFSGSVFRPIIYFFLIKYNFFLIKYKLIVYNYAF